MVNDKVNDMFEQQQNTGKSASLAEKYANAVGQLSDANDRAAHAEHDLQVERITRQDLIDEEVARRVAEAEERIRKELEAQLADKTKELEERNKALDKRESDVDKKAETIAQNVSEQVRQQMSAAKTRFEKTALNRLADMFDMFMQAFIALGNKDSSKGQELLQKYQLAAKEAHESLTDEIKDKLAKVEAKSKSKTEHIASLVRMIFTQKRERVVFSKEERETIYDKVLASVEQSPCYEDVFWKSYASAELLAQLECNKYVLHQPFNRQIKKMKQDGLILAPSTVDDWHQGVCDKIEPLYNLQKDRVMSSLLLGADGSPFPILDCEKHKTVNHYLIQYRSVATGIPIFMVNTKNKHGRGTADIMDNLKDWKGVALMCDGYSGYDWLKKINGRI